MTAMNDLMLHFMHDIYYAEKLGVRSMAKLAKAVENKELKEAILAHREQSQQQIERLEQVFEALGKRAKGKTCAAMNGLVEEGEEAVDEFDRGPVLDAALIARLDTRVNETTVAGARYSAQNEAEVDTGVFGAGEAA